MRKLLQKIVSKSIRVSKLATLCIMILFTMQTFAAKAKIDTQNAKISVNFKKASLSEVLSDIEAKSGYHVFYNNEQNIKDITIEAKDETVADILKTILRDTELTYSFENNKRIIISKVAQQQPKDIVVKGKVIGEDKKAIPGATIIVLGTPNGAIADDKGLFTIKMKQGQSLEISFSGMKAVTKVYNTNTDNDVITLIADLMSVEDVVVTGYFTKNKESYTGAASTFTGSELRSISTGNILNSLSMLDPSFTKLTNNQMGSNPNAIPEFEIRGSGSLKSEFQSNPNMPTFIMDGFEVSAQKVYDLDPSRVKSMTVLKDAAATAIYGSRAANGVVVIETLPPSAGKLRITYNGNANFEAADLSDYNLMNAAEKVEYERRAGLFITENQRPDVADENLETYNSRLKLVAMGYNTDWTALPVKKLGVGHRHSVTLEGGDSNFRYSLSLNYSNKAGVMKGSNRDSYGGSVNLQYNTKNLRFSNYTSFDHIKSVNSPYGDFSRYTYFNPYYYPYNEDGSVNKILYSYMNYDRGYEEKFMYNWLYNTTIPSKNESGANNFINNFSVEYDILPGLKAKANISISVDDSRSDLYESRDFVHEGEENKKENDYKGRYNQSFRKGFSYDVNAYLTYFKQINKHTINAGAVYNLREDNSDATSIQVIGFPNANMDHPSMGIGYIEGARPSGSYDLTRIVGFVGNVGYSFDNKYLFDASIRSDGSSLYGENNRWGTFWSLGIGWNIHKEKFMGSNSVLNLLKLRGSVGTTGGQNFSAYQSMAMYSYNGAVSDISYAGYLGATLKAFGNKNLKWQKTDKKNVGVDFELFNRRISGSFNYYSDLSKDVLIDVSIAPSLGFDSYMENLGKVKNTGVELSLKGSIIKLVKQDFIWDVTFNLVHNKNQVMEINKALTAFNERQDANVSNTPVIRYQEGLPINTLWANESLGIDSGTGNEVFLDKNGNVTDVWDAANYKPLGNGDPTIYGNFGTSLFFKGWELNASFYYKAGGETYNQTLVNKIENVNPNQNGDRRILTDRWNKPGDIARYKKVSDVSSTEPTSRFIEKENLIQLQSISVAYQFNSEKLRKIGIERFRISAIGNDIFTASTIRMERGISYPFARTFSISAQLTF